MLTKFTLQLFPYIWVWICVWVSKPFIFSITNCLCESFAFVRCCQVLLFPFLIAVFQTKCWNFFHKLVVCHLVLFCTYRNICGKYMSIYKCCVVISISLFVFPPLLFYFLLLKELSGHFNTLCLWILTLNKNDSECSPTWKSKQFLFWSHTFYTFSHPFSVISKIA